MPGRREQDAARGGQLMRTAQAAEIVFPRMGAQRLQDPFGEDDGVTAIGAADTRAPPCLHTLYEVLQFARELVALLAIHFQQLQMTREQLFAKART